MSTARHIWQPLWQLPSRAELIYSFSKRELLGRYKGSALGIAWAVLTPVVTIAIFTFIFAGIFGARFGANASHWEYALYLFCGVLPWSMFQESVQQSANTILAHSNLVKRVVFPLEALPAAQVFAAVGNQLFATVALLIATVIIRQRLEITGLWLPVLLIPQVLFALGAAWLLSVTMGLTTGGGLPAASDTTPMRPSRGCCSCAMRSDSASRRRSLPVS